MVRKTTKRVIWCFPNIENPRKTNSVTPVKFFLCIVLYQCLKAIKGVIKGKHHQQLDCITRDNASWTERVNPIPSFMISKLMLRGLAYEERKWLMSLWGLYMWTLSLWSKLFPMHGEYFWANAHLTHVILILGRGRGQQGESQALCRNQ